MNVVLGGIKHCGKTTFGKLLAEQNRALFVDTDELIEANYFLQNGEKCSCREIFRKLGSDGFRALEAEALRQLAASCDEFDSERVIALGGGVPANVEIDIADIRRLGVFVFLDLAPEIAYQRILAEGLPPFLASADEPEKAFAELCASRRLYYENCADLIFSPDPDLSAEDNLEKLNSLLGERK